MYISITGLKTLNFLSEVKFWWYAIPSFRAAQKASGNVFCEKKIVGNYKHTLTAWKSKNDMLEYIHNKVHAKAMINFRTIVTGSTFGFESEKIPSWDEAINLWKKNYKEY